MKIAPRPWPARPLVGSGLTASLLLSLLGCSATETVKGSGCEGCHRPANQEQGLEVPHPMAAIACVQCHGGDPEGTSIGQAHVANPTGGDLRNLGWTELLATDPAYRRFLNPSDPSAAAGSCGTGSNCHQAIVEQVAQSVHSTAAGLVNVPRIIGGLSTAPDRAISPAPGLSAVTPAAAVNAASSTAEFLDYSYRKACSGCHLGAYGALGPGRTEQLIPNGCAACHVAYGQEALGGSGDPTVNRTEPGHPLQHRLVAAVADAQCEACHYRSLRIGTQFRGLRELTQTDLERGTENLALSTEPLHGHPAGFYVLDDDVRDDLDTTPPDIHHERGLGCVDCHFGSEVHGDGHVSGVGGVAPAIECSDCHGSFDAEISAIDGSFRSNSGVALRRLSQSEDGRYWLEGALDGRLHPVTQVKALRQTPLVANAHEVARHGQLECYACHTAWMQNFYLSERILDLRQSEASSFDGQESLGTVRELNHLVGLEAVHLGLNEKGKIGTFLVDNTLLSVIVPCDPRTELVACESTPEEPIFGKKIIDRYLGRTAAGELSLGYYPAFAHTIRGRGQIQPCERCHPRPYEVDPGRPAAAFGRGNGRYRWTETGTAATVDLSRMVDEAGVPLVPFPHPQTRPVPLEVVERALRYEVTEPLR